MRLLLRNTRKVEYLPPTGIMTDVNEDGDHTGEFTPVYGDPVWYRGNLSTPSGRTNQLFYGEEIRYTHVLVLNGAKADIRETGLFRIDGELYEIEAVRPSLNFTSAALRKQTVDYGEIEPIVPDDGDDGDDGDEGDGG